MRWWTEFDDGGRGAGQWKMRTSQNLFAGGQECVLISWAPWSEELQAQTLKHFLNRFPAFDFLLSAVLLLLHNHHKVVVLFLEFVTVTCSSNMLPT